MERGIMRNFLRLSAAAWLAIFAATPAGAEPLVNNGAESTLNAALAIGGTIYFQGNFTTTITSTKNITNHTLLYVLDGYNVAISGSNAVRLFNVSPGINFAMRNIKLINGRSTNGGAIYNNGGTVSATNTLFAFNTAAGGNGSAGASGSQEGNPGKHGTNGFGGAIFNTGAAVFWQCSFKTNSAGGGNGGRGGDGEVPFYEGGLGGNGADAFGGAIYNQGQVSLLQCSLDYNSATGGRGGDGGTGSTGTQAFGGEGGGGGKGFGGAIYNSGGLLMTDSSIASGWTIGGEGGDGGSGYVVGRGGSGDQGAGGAIYSIGFNTNLNSTFAVNSSQSGDSKHGGINNGSTYEIDGRAGISSLGGAVCDLGTNLAVNCTFYGNAVFASDGGNSLAGWSAGNGGNGGSGWGGNLYTEGRTMLTNCTVAAGGAQAGTGGTGLNQNGSNGSSRGGNVAKNGGVFILHNTILYYPSIGTNGYTGSGAFTDGGFCISSDRSVTLNGSGSTTNTNPMLGPLTTNGGLTMTMAVLPGSPCIDGGDTNFCLSIDQRGHVRPGGGRCDIGAYESIPTIITFPEDSWASEQGDVGIITLFRTEGTAPLTVQYSMTGSAINDVDYVSLTGSATFPEGIDAARIIVRPLSDGSTEPEETVSINLLPGAAYLISDPTNAMATIADRARPVSDQRYIRGTGTSPTYHSFVIPLDFQKGVKLDDVGGNATNLFPSNTWVTNFYHFNATNPAPQTDTNGRIVFRNPIVAFGARVGGSALEVGRTYHFGTYSGASTTTNFPQFRIKVYNRTNFALINTQNIYIPPPWVSNTWTGFSTNGYSAMSSANGLTTFITRKANLRWGLTWEDSYVVSHKADSTAAAYLYEIESRGQAIPGSMVSSTNVTFEYSKLYTVEFESRPAWRSLFVNQPHFNGKPLPPDYEGKSAEELLTASTFLATNPSPTALSWTNLDTSPELRRHPILDQFVSDLNRDPIALVNYVFNEIELTDAFGYDDEGDVTESSVNPPGVNRSALATYQEGQGSPVEQCALLIYLLRQAGYPASYVFPSDESVKLLDTRLSSILQLQLRGVVDNFGRNLTTNRLIAVNYPWVATYIGTNWVHLFPWMKDTEIVEGFGLYDYMPTNYNNGYKWMRDYLYGKTNILALSSDDDTPATLFPKFLQQVLLTNAPGLSTDDIGVRVINRRNNYSRWTDFPKPTLVGSSNVPVENLSSIALTNVSRYLTNIFDTVSIEVYSVANPTNKIVTGELRMADLHNRKFLARHEKITTNSHRLILSLAPYRPDTTNEAPFSAVDPYAPADPDVLQRLSMTNVLGASDDQLKIKFTHRKQRSLPPAFTEPGFWDAYPGFFLTRTAEIERPFRKGDLAAICLNAGRVTRRMLQVHAEELWQMEQLLGTNSLATNSISADVYQGTPAYLEGMSYYEKVSRFTEQNERWHKVKSLSRFAAGLARFNASRNGSGQLPSGNIDLILPVVDMFYQQIALVGNGSLHPDSGLNSAAVRDDFAMIGIANDSAQEHAIINQFLFQKDAVSTVKLLRLAQQRGTNGQPGIILLTAHNYLIEGEKIYPTTGSTKLKDYDPQLWSQLVAAFEVTTDGDYSQAFITPWPVANATASYTGMGALLFTPNSYGALISGSINGGTGENMAAGTLAAPNSPKIELNVDANGNYSVGTKAATPGSPTVAPEFSTQADAAGDVAGLQNGSYFANPDQVIAGLVNGVILDGVAGTHNSLADDFLNRAPQGDGDMRNGNGSKGTVADPVNTLTGEFYVDAADLTLPGPMPLQLRRNYGSHNLSPNQLGYGWKLNYMPFLTSSQGTNFYASDPDGSVLVLVQIGADLWAPTTTNNPTLNNYTTDGIGSAANRLNVRMARVFTNSVNTYYLTNTDGALRVFEEKSFPLGAGLDRQRPYLTKWFDNRGNFYTFEYGTNSSQTDYGQVRRILSSNGNLLGFQYDVYGRVTEAYTLDGRRVFYRFDEHGDLVLVTLPDASERQFEYQHLNWTTNSVTYNYSTHLLTKELKPDGRVLQNEYDSLRRVTNQWATVGDDLRLIRNATFRYTNNFTLTNLTALLTGTTTVLDYTNRVLRYFYTNGLVRKVTDPLNQSILQTWYEVNETNPPAYPRSLKTVMDKRGLVTTYLYDLQGNVTNTTIRGDLRGDGDTNATVTTLATFTANNLPAKTVDPTGTTNLFFYTNNWLLVRVENWPSNATPAQAITNLFVYHDVTNTSDGTVSYGLRQREIRAAYSADASTNEWDHDSRGFVTRALRYTGTADPTLVVTNLHNRRGELVERTDAIGRATRFAYDARGRLEQREIFESGQSSPLAWDFSYYNPNGELTWSDGPRFDPEDYTWRDYDGDGRLTTIIRWRSQAKADGTGVEAPAGDDLYSTTFFDFDPFGNQTRVINPRGIVTTNSFDAVGQLIGRKVLDTNGTQLTSEGFAYEPGGLVTRSTNALGAVSQTLYTSTGKPKFRKNTDGSTNAWRYLEDGRPRREIQHNGAYWETTYNDAARSVTRIFYSSANVALATNVTELDRRGNVVRSVDAGGFISTNRFDALDRIKVAAGPSIVSISPTNLPNIGGGTGPVTSIVQQVSTYLYDSSGKVLTVSNALKERIVTTRDALDRVVRAEVLGSSGASVRLTTTAYAANHHSATITNGSGASAIVSTTYTDHDGNAVLSLRYPSANLVEFDWQQFDSAGNRVASQQASRASSQVTVWTTNGWTYDGLNRVETAAVRDGATTTFSYDPLGSLTNRAMPGGLNWRATYNTAGQRLKEFDIGAGNLASRTNNYSYYASNSIYAGLLQTRTDGRLVTCTHTYDDWLRATTNTYTGSSNYHNLTTITRFDARGLVTNIAENFATNSTGTAVSIRRNYDAYRLLTSELIYTNNGVFSSAQQAWDSAGRRDGLGYSGSAYNFDWRADGLLASSLGITGGGIYSYNDAGQLVSRTIGPKVTTFTSRDGAGRPLSIGTTIDGTDRLDESLGYTGDGRIATHAVTRINTADDYTDDRAYFYADYSRRLTEERLNLSGFKRWTNSFLYDNGAASGPGVLTRAGAAVTNLAQWSGALDGLSRMTNATNNVIRRLAYGRINGPATITTAIDSQPMPVTIVGTGNTTWTNQWRATLELTPGAHQLTATARHPSGQFTTNAAIWFTNNASAPDRVQDIFDLDGNVTRRIWRSANGTTNRSQTLSWDARGRLYKIVERDAQTNGFDWTPVYDPLGRKLRTVEVPVTNGVSLTAQVLVIEQYFDPQVRFMALGVSVAGKTTWRLMGPDMNGRYGGLQGRGGFDAIMPPEPKLFCPTIADARGNILAVYDVSHKTLSWNTSRPTGYGAVPTYRPPPLGRGADLIQATAFAGIWSDVTGYYWRGNRYYDPIAGRWLSGDPLGHDSDISLFTYAGGDPINFDDPDGLAMKEVVETASKGIDFGANLAIALLAGNQNSSAFTSEERSAITQNFIDKYGSPMRRYFNAYDSPSPIVDQLPAQVGPVVQDAGVAYYTGRSTATSARYEPVRGSAEMQSGAPLEPVGRYYEANQIAIVGPVGIEEPAADPAPAARGSLNPATRAAALSGTSLHADRPGRLPDQLRSMYPETEFNFTPPGKSGQDVQVIGGMHPSFYPYGAWPEGINFGDFKPNTPGGFRTFRSDQLIKWNAPTFMLRYDPQTGKLTSQ